MKSSGGMVLLAVGRRKVTTKSMLLDQAKRSLLFSSSYASQGNPRPSTEPGSSEPAPDSRDHWNKEKVNAFVGHSFPDFIEDWNRTVYKKIGYGLTAATALTTAGTAALCDTISLDAAFTFIPAGVLGAATTGYWYIGLNDIKQTHHAVRRNYPLLGNMRYIFETIRPELRQYIVESDFDGKPFDRLHRSLVYQRSKNVDSTLAFGTRRNVYEIQHEWSCHSMWPHQVTEESAKRHTIGTAEYGTTKPYSSSVLNISAMSYGAISDNAIQALNQGAKLGGFSHNTGEGGVSRFHKDGGADIVWNIGTGYFGCGSGEGHHRKFEPTMFQETIDECDGQIKMVELKLSQGAKPGHGGLLPKAKISREIANARKLPFPPVSDCHSPAGHSAFSTPVELVEFIAKVRELSDGLPVGIKVCIGQPHEFAALCRAIDDVGNGPDFITVDGAEGGTGAAPPEFINSVGLPLEEGLVLARNMLVGANLREKTKIIASGRVMSGFALTRTIALGADVVNSARGFMLSLGCIQALKCNTNKCPTGIATTDRKLMYGLDPDDKTVRVYNFHSKTVEAGCEILGAMGHNSFAQVTGNDFMRRVRTNEVRTLSEHFPNVNPGCLIERNAPTRLQAAWDAGAATTRAPTSSTMWIY